MKQWWRVELALLKMFLNVSTAAVQPFTWRLECRVVCNVLFIYEIRQYQED